MINIVSCSGGKDSTATLLVAIERGAENLSGVFADTGNEHPMTYDYVRYLEGKTGVKIKWLKADFSKQLAVRKEKLLAIADGAPDYFPRAKFPWTPENARKAAALMSPTGNPYLDLCLLKGRFPSRTAQFCTTELKTLPMTEYQLELLDAYGALTSWQGVRAEESASRAALPQREDKGGGYTIYRPIHKWTAAQVFEQHRKHGIEPNPLYKLGMGRVGCMPCINCRKDELREISKRFPEQIERIREWEEIVAEASRSGQATFFAAPGDTETAGDRGGVLAMVEWSKTSRGGKNKDWVKELEEPLACSSAYGLCE